MTKSIAGLKSQLLWTEGMRALLCMLPMLVAAGLGKTSFLVALGQGGFFFSSLFLPGKRASRFVMGCLILAIGLGFYLIGGNVAASPGMALLFTFMVSMSLAFLSSWNIGGPLALTFIMIYTSGLNTGSAEKAASNFLLFAFVLTWSAVISLLPFWKGIEPPPVNPKLKTADYAEQGVRMGVGTTIALGISFLFGFSKLGWAPSAVGNVVRYDGDTSKKRAWGRFAGTIGGAIMAVIVMGLTDNLIYMVYFGAFFAVMNGLFKKTKLGMIPLFYTATILILYSANSVGGGKMIALERVAFNLVGICVAMLVVYYPFPALMRKIQATAAS